MPSNLSAFPYIQERSEATPGLWNYPFSVLSANIASLDSTLNLGHFQQLSIGSTPPSYATTAAVTIEVNSAYSDYFYLVDSSGQKSSYVIGSRAGNLADGLNIWDASAGTMIASFSKQSIRFFQQVVGPVFDLGGALTDTYNAATFGTGSQSSESRIQAAINQAAIDGVSRVYVPASMYPYSASSVSFIHTLQMVREGGTFDVYDVKAYGASGDTTTDDSAAFRATEAARALAVATLYIPAGAYKLASVITSSAAYTHWRGESGAVLLSYVTIDAPVKFVGGSLAQGQYHTVRVQNLRIRNAVSAHRIPLITFGDSKALTGLNIDDLELDANFLPRDGMLLDRVFEGSLRLVALENFQSNGTGMGVGCNYRATDLNSGNIHFDTWTSTTNPILFLFNETPGEGNVINSVHLNNCKLGRGTFINTNKFFAGTVSGSQQTSATTIALSAGQGANYTNGDWIVVANSLNGKLWVDRVVSVTVDTLNLAATTGLPFGLVNGDACVVGYWHSIVGPNTRNVQMSVPHFERTNGVLGSGSHMVTINTPSLGVNLFRGCYLLQDCQGYEMRMPQELTPISSSAIIFDQAGAGFTNRNRLVGPVKITSGATFIRVAAGTTAAFVGRYGGNESLLGVWHQSFTVAASQGSTQLVGPNMAADRGIRLRAKGAMVALNAQTTTARSAGTLTATVFVNNLATSLQAIIDGSNTFNKLTELYDDSNAVTFNPGDLCDVRVTTTSDWAPTSNNVDVSLYVSQ